LSGHTHVLGKVYPKIYEIGCIIYRYNFNTVYWRKRKELIPVTEIMVMYGEQIAKKGTGTGIGKVL